VGYARHSDPYPSKSAILGLVAAALGITRNEEEKLQRLQESIGFGVRIDKEGELILDYHTAQVPSRADLKKRPHATRRDELSIPKLNTVLSMREYFCDAVYTIILWQRTDDVLSSLASIKKALLNPAFVLYLGRKSCPLALPLQPLIINAKCIEDSLVLADDLLMEKKLTEKKALTDLDYIKKSRDQDYKLYWDIDGSIENEPDMQITRKDRLISRARWQYGDRPENYKMTVNKGEK